MAAFTGPCGLWPNGGSQLQTYLNTAVSDTMDICLLSSINKWSKIKPVRVSTEASLTEAQFKAATGDYGSGYAYGVRVRYIHTSSFGDLHDWTFDYGKPNNYYRLDDFYGYDKDAAPDIDGSVATEFYRDASSASSLYVNIGRNSTGVPIIDIVKESMSMSGATDKEAFSHIYPFIFVGDHICALQNSLTNSVTPIVYNGAWYTDYTVDLEALNEISEIPLGNETPFTLFLVEVGVSNTEFEPYLDGNWVEIGGISSSTLLTVPVYPIPNATGIYPEIKELGIAPPDMTLIMPTSANIRGFSVNYTFASAPTQDVIMNITARVTPSVGTSTLSYTHDIDASLQIAPSFSWTGTDIGAGGFGLAAAPADGTLLQLEVSITYFYGSSAQRVKTVTATSGIIVDYTSL